MRRKARDDPQVDCSQPAKRRRNGAVGLTQKPADKGKSKAKTVDLSLDSSKYPEGDGLSDEDRNEDGEDDEGGEEDDEEIPHPGPSNHSARVLRGWETRRARRAAEIKRQEELVHPSRLQSMQSASAHFSTQLPTSDLLQSLHQHASAFYTTHGLLLPPSGKGRQHAWGSKKRILILRDEASPSISASGSASPFNQGSSDDDVHEEGEDELEREDEEEDEEGGGHRIKSEYGTGDGRFVDQYGEVKKAKSGLPKADALAWKDGRKSRSKGRYKLRDMRMSLDGSALMALGMLTQEIILQKLHEAGYRPLRGTSITQPPTASLSSTNASDKRQRKNGKTNAAFTIDENHDYDVESSSSEDSFLRHQRDDSASKSGSDAELGSDEVDDNEDADGDEASSSSHEPP